jgi:hypothetical protein
MSNLDALVKRFLTWPVPAEVYPDGTPGQPGRTGTNLLTYAQAQAMLEHVLQDATAPAAASDAPRMLSREELRREQAAWSDWAWNKPGEAIGVQHGQSASWEAWQARAALATAPAAAAVPVPLPIATAPKAEIVLLWSSRRGAWDMDRWGAFQRINHPGYTHWSPLPPDPHGIAPQEADQPLQSKEQ